MLIRMRLSTKEAHTLEWRAIGSYPLSFPQHLVTMTKAFKLNWHLEVPQELQDGATVARWTEVIKGFKAQNYSFDTWFFSLFLRRTGTSNSTAWWRSTIAGSSSTGNRSSGWDMTHFISYSMIMELCYYIQHYTGIVIGCCFSCVCSYNVKTGFIVAYLLHFGNIFSYISSKFAGR